MSIDDDSKREHAQDPAEGAVTPGRAQQPSAGESRVHPEDPAEGRDDDTGDDRPA